MRRRSPVVVLACLWLIAGWGCGPQPDLKSLKLVNALSGYYDDGPTPKGENHLVPSVTFQLKNEGDLPFTYVDLMLAFWPVGADGEKDSKLIQSIGRTPLEPGATSESFTVRSAVGFTSLYPRAEFFTRPEFVGFIVKVFARRSGKLTSLAEVAVDRRLLPAVHTDGRRP